MWVLIQDSNSTSNEAAEFWVWPAPLQLTLEQIRDIAQAIVGLTADELELTGENDALVVYRLVAFGNCRQILVQMVITPASWIMYSGLNLIVLREGPRFTSMPELRAQLDFMANVQRCCGLDQHGMGVFSQFAYAAYAQACSWSPAGARLHAGMCAGVFLKEDLIVVKETREFQSKGCQALRYATMQKMKRSEQTPAVPHAQTNRQFWTTEQWAQKFTELEGELANRKKEGQVATKMLRRKVDKSSSVECDEDITKKLHVAVQAVYSDPELHQALESILKDDSSGVLRSLMFSNLKAIHMRQVGRTTGNRFSQHFIRVMMQIYLRSPSALKMAGEELIIGAPSNDTMTKYLQGLIPDDGFTEKNMDLLHRSACLYEMHTRTWKGEGIPRGRGIITFDEIRVKGGVILNAKNQVSDGFAGTDAQLYNLADMYQHLQTGDVIPCRYILLTQWRCMDSDFNMSGPMLSSHSGLNYLQIHRVFWQSVEQLQKYHFSTETAICNGASYNLKFICFNCGVSDSVVQPWCTNPHTGRPIVFMFDPPHHMKRMRTALFSSRLDKNPRQFSISPVVLRKHFHLYIGRWENSHGGRALLTRQQMELLSTCVLPEKGQDEEEKDLTSLPKNRATGCETESFIYPETELTEDRTLFGFWNVEQLHFEQEEQKRAGVFNTADLCFSKEVVYLTNWSTMRVHLAKKIFTERAAAVIGAKIISQFNMILTARTKKDSDNTKLRAILAPGDPNQQTAFDDIATAHSLLEKTLVMTAKEYIALLLYSDSARAIYVDTYMNGKVLLNFQEPRITAFLDGFNFYLDWRDDWATVISERKSSKNKLFLHRMTWLEMRVMIIATLKIFENRFNDGRAVCASRLSQSALESLFGAIRGLQRGSGGLTKFSFRRGLAAMAMFHEAKIFAKDPTMEGGDNVPADLELRRMQPGVGAISNAKQQEQLQRAFGSFFI